MSSRKGKGRRGIKAWVKEKQINLNTALALLGLLLAVGNFAFVTIGDVDSDLLGLVADAESAMDSGDLLEAEKNLTEASVWWWRKKYIVELSRARLRFLQDEVEDAYQMVSEVVRERGDIPLAHLRLGSWLFELGQKLRNDPQARRLSGDGLRDWRDYYRRGREEMLLSVAGSNPRDLPEALRLHSLEANLRVAAAFLESGDLSFEERSRGALERCSLFPENAEANACKGFAFLLARQYRKAISAYERAREIDRKAGRPDSPTYLARLGYLYYRTDQFDKAATALEQSLDIQEQASVRRFFDLVQAEVGSAM